jgi:molecular chaperone HscB
MPTYAPELERLEGLHFTEAKELAALAGDHFEVFALPRRLQVDEAELKTVFYALSRRFHPDYFGTASDEVKRLALEKTAQLNAAFRTLRDPQPRAEYLLSVAAPDIQPGSNNVPPGLLEEMFDIQEAGEDLRAARLAGDADALAEAESRVKPLRALASETRHGLVDELTRLFAQYDAAADAADPAAHDVLKAIRATLDQMNYLRTVLRNLK